jgi:hypothetical protein
LDVGLELRLRGFENKMLKEIFGCRIRTYIEGV